MKVLAELPVLGELLRRPLGLLSRPHPRRALPIGDEADRRRAVDH